MNLRFCRVALKLLTVSAALSSLLILMASGSATATNLAQQPSRQLANAPTSQQTKPSSSRNLIVNGGFESTPPLNHQQWGLFEAIQGWLPTPGNQIEIQQDGYAGAPDQGRNLLELDSANYTVTPDQPLGVYQMLPTTQGKHYRLTFDYSPRPDRPAADNQFQVSFDGKVLQNFAEGASGQQTDWHRYSTVVEATSDVSRLEFDYTGSRDHYGAYLDNVSLTPVVDLLPGAALASLSGIAGIPLALAGQAQPASGTSPLQGPITLDYAIENHGVVLPIPIPDSPKPQPINPAPAELPEPQLPAGVLALEAVAFLGLLKHRWSRQTKS